MSQTAVSDVCTGLLTAVSTALSASTLGTPNRIVYVPGNEVAWDKCDCGQLGLHVVNRYRTRQFPLSGVDVILGNCDDVGMVIDCAMSIVRCVPGPGDDDDDMAPDPTALRNTAIAFEQDAFIVWDTTQCYMTGLKNATPKTITDFIINEQVSLGPLGNCAGTELHFKFGLYVNCGCG
jgi:hypothetical protein